ncbi:MAG TPA: thiol reductant ABC exporter subunit CydC [Methanotrichaceae archaeon]|nr:thiol reductant ABC exporter subunit CydC [Methanotrichaceae archaeon]HQF15760.1 thiol reductant ABC exporter subunit CydC [Methanotrichaceae archaeon]HQI90566.1 thiol reductant ABC exporter subunit CydC [Methanotrichaceae archaeon]
MTRRWIREHGFLSDDSEILRLLDPIRPHLRLMGLAVFSEVLRQVSGIGVAVLGAVLFARAVSGAPTSELYPLAGSMILLGLARGAFGYLGPYLAHVAAYRILVSLRDRFYSVMEPLAPAKLSPRRTGDVVSTAVSDIELLELFFAHTAGPAVVAIVVPVLAFSALAAISPRLAGVLLVYMMLLATLPRFAFWIGSALGSELREQIAHLNSQVLDSLQAMREVLAFGYRDKQMDELSGNSKALIALQARQARNMGLQGALGICIVSAGVISVLLSASLLVRQGSLSPSYLPVSVILAGSVFTSLMGVVETSKQLSQTMAGARRLFRLLDLQPAVREGAAEFSNVRAKPGPTSQAVEPSIAFEDVCFRYSPAEPRVLSKMRFDVPAGSTVALVGQSGAGKSTVVSLMLRFWDPEAGRILLGGRDIRCYSLDKLRLLFSVVSQDVFLFNQTIRENIRIGRGDASDMEVEDAARKARLHDFIVSLPHGYDTMVGERGVGLSGGERQRMAIARALLKGAPILILDEATSSLDAESESYIRDTLRNARAGRTTFMIAHRLSTVVDADMILVMKDGRVVEQGRHGDLLALRGEYARLVAAQRCAADGGGQHPSPE